ncbi:MAG TPA: hypothetical protein VF701_02885 [Thermoanaerobaculia bacterium]
MNEIQDAYEKEFQALQQEAERRAGELQDEGKKLEKDAKAQFKVDLIVRWVDRKVVMNLPQITMKTTTVILDLPSVTMRLQELIFHTPSVRMVPKVVGRYPEFHGLKIVMRDIIVHVPEGFMEEQRIKMDLPEVRMERQELKFDYPDVSWGETEFVLRLPEVEVKDISFIIPINNEDVKRRGAELRERGEKIGAETRQKAEALAARMQADVITAGFAAARSEAETAGNTYAEYLTKVETTVADGVQKVDRTLAEHNLPAETVDALTKLKADIIGKGVEAKTALKSIGDILDTEKQDLAA